MAKRIRVGVELDAEANVALEQWAEDEGRSKRRQAALLIRKLTKLRKANAPDLMRLGLVDRRGELATA